MIEQTPGPASAGLDRWPPLEDVLSGAVVVALPLRRRFRGVDVREVMLIEGPEGWGEFAPFAEYADDEARWWLASALQAAYAPAPQSARARVEVNATVPAVPAVDVPAVLAGYDGCRTVKVKVAEPGQTLAEDVARVGAVRDHVGAAGRIRVDANGAWTPPEAVRAITELSQVSGDGLEYAEQPCRSVAELVELRGLLRRAGVEVPLAADESIRKAGDPLAVAHTGAVDVAVVKVAPLGGVRRMLAIAEQLDGLGVAVVVSSAIDSSVGLATGVRAAACLPGEPRACGLGTGSLLAGDVTNHPLQARGGRIELRDVRPESELLGDFRARPERTAWWQERLARCHRRLVRGDR